jgi:transcriptional regulator with PAS, ATPase and Fis domain
MQALYAEMQPLLGGSVPVLITGETGVGKEMIARALHLSSPRADRSFVAVNCAAIPSELLEAELFGVVRGAATGVSPRRGKLQVADGGVLLLDEIGDMPPALQAKLLRALQDGEVLPVGADRPVKVDVWVLSATNTDIIERVRQGSFRQDLYYRLAGATLHVPALRQRPDDIAPLVTAFLTDTSVELDKSIRGMSLKALATLERAPWPGNVRQLRHEIRSLALRCPPGATIEFTLLPDSLANPAADTQPATVNGDSLNLPARIAALEHELIATALRLARGNRSAAARLLGISRIGLYKKLRRVPPL